MLRHCTVLQSRFSFCYFSIAIMIASQYIFNPFILSGNYIMSILICAMWLWVLDACTNLLCAIHLCSAHIDAHIHRYTLFVYWDDPFFSLLTTGSFSSHNNMQMYKIRAFEFIFRLTYVDGVSIYSKNAILYLFDHLLSICPFPRKHGKWRENIEQNAFAAFSMGFVQFDFQSHT